MSVQVLAHQGDSFHIDITRIIDQGANLMGPVNGRPLHALVDLPDARFDLRIGYSKPLLVMRNIIHPRLIALQIPSRARLQWLQKAFDERGNFSQHGRAGIRWRSTAGRR
ncbi:MAG: hypothetical protein KatS3mg110_0883 [Pirellulaceae bacterium]|nr:MAG: hypothetical protein KatS3mg110_0883 [Pirellulaceae bacterium]